MEFTSPDFARRLEDLAVAYRDFLAARPVGSVVGEQVLLYGHREVEERNQTYQVADYLPDYVSIGNDSGDDEFLLRRDGSETVYREDPGCFGDTVLRVAHPSFSDWLACDCPLPCEPESPIPLCGCLWLVSAPAGGIRDMFRLKKILGMAWSVPQMVDYMNHVPVLLDEDSPLMAVDVRIGQYEELREHLGFSETNQGDRQPFPSITHP